MLGFDDLIDHPDLDRLGPRRPGLRLTGLARLIRQNCLVVNPLADRPHDQRREQERQRHQHLVAGDLGASQRLSKQGEHDVDSHERREHEHAHRCQRDQAKKRDGLHGTHR